MVELAFLTHKVQYDPLFCDFERAWDQAKDTEAKKRAVVPMNQAVHAFFAFNLAAVGSTRADIQG